MDLYSHVERATVWNKETRTTGLEGQLKSANSEADGEVSLGNSDGTISRSLVLPDLVLRAVVANQSFQVSSTAGLGDGILGEVMDLLLRGAAGVSTSGDILGQGREEVVVNRGARVGSLDGQALLLLLLREGHSGSHFEKFGVMKRVWKLLVVVSESEVFVDDSVF